MLGKILQKPIQQDYLDTPEGVVKNNSESTESNYLLVAQWCNDNDAMIVDRGDYYEVVPQEKFEPTEEEKAKMIRDHRDVLLSETDKFMRPDFPINEIQRKEVIEYSKLLRDLPEQAGFPNEVTFPEKPDFMKN